MPVVQEFSYRSGAAAEAVKMAEVQRLSGLAQKFWAINPNSTAAENCARRAAKLADEADTMAQIRGGVEWAYQAAGRFAAVRLEREPLPGGLTRENVEARAFNPRPGWKGIFKSSYQSFPAAEVTATSNPLRVNCIAHDEALTISLEISRQEAKQELDARRRELGPVGRLRKVFGQSTDYSSGDLYAARERLPEVLAEMREARQGARLNAMTPRMVEVNVNSNGSLPAYDDNQWQGIGGNGL